MNRGHGYIASNMACVATQRGRLSTCEARLQLLRGLATMLLARFGGRLPRAGLLFALASAGHSARELWPQLKETFTRRGHFHSSGLGTLRQHGL